MAGLSESGPTVGDRRSLIRGHRGGTGGRDGAHPVFQPSIANMAQTRPLSENRLRSRPASESGRHPRSAGRPYSIAIEHTEREE